LQLVAAVREVHQVVALQAEQTEKVKQDIQAVKVVTQDQIHTQDLVAVAEEPL
jgi:hypothetical protein